MKAVHEHLFQFTLLQRSNKILPGCSFLSLFLFFYLFLYIDIYIYLPFVVTCGRKEKQTKVKGMCLYLKRLEPISLQKGLKFEMKFPGHRACTAYHIYIPTSFI